MKPVFGMDITKDKNNPVMNSPGFISRAVSRETLKAFLRRREELQQKVEHSRLPAWIRGIRLVSGFAAMILLIGILKALRRTPLSEALRNAPELFCALIVCGLLWGILVLLAARKEKRVFRAENAEQALARLERDAADMLAELQVPADAAEADILVFSYKVKNGELRPYASPLQSTPYRLWPAKVYAADGGLCIADFECVYFFSGEEMRAIRTVRKLIAARGWNKEDAPNEGVFKQYKLTVNNMDDVFLKPYYILEILHEGETYGVYFPAWELPVFEKLTGLTAEE